MKNIIKSAALAAVSMVVLSGMAAAADNDAYDWSGFYIGGGIGATQSMSDADVVYGTTGTEAWTNNGEFTGNVYDDMDDASVSLKANSGADPASATLSMPALQPWLTSASMEELDVFGSGYLGFQQQFDSIVIGAELKGSIGNFGNSFGRAWNETHNINSETVTCPIGSGGCVATVDFGGNSNTPPTWSIDPLDTYDNISGISITAGDDVVFDGRFWSSNELRFGTEYDYIISPTARLGFTVDRFMVFVAGGPAVAKVKATTSASVDEYGEMDVVTPGTETAHTEGSESYAWNGSNTETKWGYTVGGGVEWAVTDNMIVRFEGSYTDLGSILVTGVSDQTGATYTVDQDLRSYSGMTGLTIKF